MAAAKKRHLTYHLPFPPSVNAIWRSNRGRVHLSKKGKDFYEAGEESIYAQGPQSFDGPVKITIEISPPNRRKFDIDNKSKAVLDLLVRCAIIKDDSYIFVPELKLKVNLKASYHGVKVRIEETNGV